MPIRVLLADDPQIVREALRALLESEGLLVVGEASDGQAALRLAVAERPDVAVLDLTMPVLNGIDAARAIFRDAPGTRVVLLTVHRDDHYVQAALGAGIQGYVLKTQATGDLLTAIEEVAAGRIYLSPGVSRAAADPRRVGVGDSLTPRERQVLQLIAEGKSTKEIASILGVSVKTADTHRTRLMDKLDIHDVAGVVRYAVRHGIVQP